MPAQPVETRRFRCKVAVPIGRRTPQVRAGELEPPPALRVDAGGGLDSRPKTNTDVIPHQTKNAYPAQLGGATDVNASVPGTQAFRDSRPNHLDVTDLDAEVATFAILDVDAVSTCIHDPNILDQDVSESTRNAAYLLERDTVAHRVLDLEIDQDDIFSIAEPEAMATPGVTALETLSIAIDGQAGDDEISDGGTIHHMRRGRISFAPIGKTDHRQAFSRAPNRQVRVKTECAPPPGSTITIRVVDQVLARRKTDDPTFAGSYQEG